MCHNFKKKHENAHESHSQPQIPETQKKKEFGMADIKELDQDEKDNDPIIEINEEANVNYITVNKIRIGKVHFQ